MFDPAPKIPFNYEDASLDPPQGSSGCLGLVVALVVAAGIAIGLSLPVMK